MFRPLNDSSPTGGVWSPLPARRQTALQSLIRAALAAALGAPRAARPLWAAASLGLMLAAGFARSGAAQTTDMPSDPAPPVMDPSAPKKKARPAREQKPEVPNGPETSHQHLGRVIDQMAQKMDWGGGRLGIEIFDPRAGLPVLRKNEDQGMAPGGAVKLMVAVAALDQLGPDYAFTTTLSMDGAVEKKTLRGGLTVRSDGDPTMSSQLAQDPHEVYATFDRWAEILRARKIKTIEGPIRIDETAFDAERAPIGWPEAWSAAGLLPDVSAVNFNDNRVELLWKPGKKDGKVAEYEAIPALKDLYYLSNNVHYAERVRIPGRKFKRESDPRLVGVTGKIPLKTAERDRFAIADPARFYGEALKARLIEKKIKVLGAVEVIRPEGWKSSKPQGKWGAGSAPAAPAPTPKGLVDISGENNKDANAADAARSELKRKGKQRGEAEKGRYVAPNEFGGAEAGPKSGADPNAEPGTEPTADPDAEPEPKRESKSEKSRPEESERAKPERAKPERAKPERAKPERESLTRFAGKKGNSTSGVAGEGAAPNSAEANIAAAEAALSGAQDAEPVTPPRGPQTVLDSFHSAPLGRIITTMIAKDRALDAEVLVKAMARLKTGKPGSTRAGIELVQESLREMRLPASGLVLLDGSGISSVNRIPAKLLANFVARLSDSAHGRLVLGAIPRSDAPGALEGRFKSADPEKPSPPGPVVAMPGELPDGASLVGSVRTLSGRDLQFAIIVNGSKLPPDELRRNIDLLVMELAFSS